MSKKCLWILHYNFFFGTIVCTYTLGCRRDVKGVEKVESPVIFMDCKAKTAGKLCKKNPVILITSAGNTLLCYSALFEVWWAFKISFNLTWGAVSRGELEREDEAPRGGTFRPAWDGGGLVGDVGQERPGRAWTGLWLPSESLLWELGGVGGICRDSRPKTQRLDC